MSSRRVVLFALAVVGIVGLMPRVGAARAETPRTVYISATDSKGAAITDLTAADLVVKENGKDRAIASLKPATEPMDVTVLVDDNGTGAFQPACLQLLQALVEHSKFTIMQFNPQAMKVLDNSNDIPAIQAALNKLGQRGKVQGEGEQIVEAVGEAAKAMHQRKSARPVIVTFTIGGDGQVRNPDIAMSQLQSTGAMLNVVYVAAGGIGQVLGDGPKQSGGRVEQAASQNAIAPAVTKITDTLLHQYELVYTLPDGVKPADRLNVSTNRKGITVLAPSRVPDK